MVWKTIKGDRIMTEVSYSDWEKLNLKTGEMLEIEDIENADKLFKLKIDLGAETRTLVAGIKGHYNKEELEGKRCIVFTNLKPRKIKGIESQGMILAASNDDNSEVKSVPILVILLKLLGLEL